MSTLQELLLISGVLSFVGINVIYKPDPQTLFRWSLLSVVGLGAVAAVVYYVDRVRGKLKTVISSGPEAREAGSDREKQVRETTQEEYELQAHEYIERVTKPKEEAKSQAKDDDFYRFSGPAWKGARKRLGGQTQKDQSAAQSRRLPVTVIKTHHTEEAPTESLVKKISLPEEPVEGAGVVTLSFRTEQRVHRRRFHLTDTVQVLLDYITTLGYHQTLYSLYTTYPRACVSGEGGRTLAEAGITHPCTLNVEED